MLTREERQRGSVYKSLETDEEFNARIHAKYIWWQVTYYTDAVLDECAWTSVSMQRRIVDREA